MASGIVVTLEGAERLQAQLNRMRGTMKNNARKVITLEALEIQRELRKKLSQPGTGRMYRKGNVVHVASAPGEPPAVDTGRYRNSITPTFFLGGMAAEVGTRLVPYPKLLEEGSPGGMIAPRPAFKPVWDTRRPLYLLHMAAAVKMLESVT